jgi:hypothetical protein
MRRPQFMTDAARIRKAQTPGVRIKDERDYFAIDSARDSVWFRVQHFLFLCQPGAPRRFGVSRAMSAGRARQTYSEEARARHVPTSAIQIAVNRDTRTRA